MKSPLSFAALAALSEIDGCTLANAIESFQIRLRNEGFADGTLHCRFPRLPPMVGYAATVKVRGATPPMGARLYPDRTDWWDYVQSLPAPRIVVVEDVSSKVGVGALLGEVHLNILRALGCAGALTNGAVRDLPAAEAMGFPLFSSGVSVSHSYVHLVEIGGEVEVGGLPIRSGDLLHGDANGVQTIPSSLALQLPAVAARMRAADQKVIAQCRAPDFTLAKLRAVLAELNA
jgi:regulator of RNase E activity RraA